MSDSGILARAASAWGVEPGYWDLWGRYHECSEAARVAILRSLGLPVDDPEGLARAVEERRAAAWTGLVARTLVASENAGGIPVAVEAGQAGLTLAARVQWEEGGEARLEAAVESLPAGESAEVAGKLYVQRLVRFGERLPLGYHRLSVSVGGQTAEAHLIVTPDRCYSPPALAGGRRAAGVAVSLFGLRSERNWGCGDVTDLERFLAWAGRELGVAFVGLNPLHAIHNRQPFNTSPYLPNSVYYRNPIYLDVERVEDFRLSRHAQQMLAEPEVQAELAALRASEFVEYERVYALKLRCLRHCFDTFRRRCRIGAERRTDFEEYCRREGALLERYALYCALDEWLHEQNPEVWIWQDWPGEYQDPDSPAVKRFAARHPGRVLFHKYLQWQLDRQLEAAQRRALDEGLVIGLYHDLALATDSCGSDLWAHRAFFLEGCRVGSPPDDFSPKGQDWGFPPPHPERHRDNGYRLFAESIRHSLRHGGALRIDHVMRFFRLFTIPSGMEAAEGTYVRADHEDLVRILALESVRNRTLIVGEDLGTVAPEIRDALRRFGVLSYRLLYFERAPDGSFLPPAAYPEQALVSSTTHDLPTLAGFWSNRDIEARRAAGLLGDEGVYQAQLAARAAEKQRMLDAFWREGLLPDWFPRQAADVPELTGELHNAAIGYLARTPAQLLLVNQEDLTKETEQQNLPGSTWQYPNWRRKMRFSLEELEHAPLARDFAAMFRHWLQETGRARR
jgi:4-alpha-glucanotransferase